MNGILTLEEIAELESNTNSRGEYKRVTLAFDKSDELAQNVMEIARFENVEPAAVFNSFNLNIAKLNDADELVNEIVCVHDKKKNRVILMNKTAIEAAVAAKDAV